MRHDTIASFLQKKNFGQNCHLRESCSQVTNWSHRFHSHLTPTQLVLIIMTALHSYSVCNRTIGLISGSFFCHLAKSVQADEASLSVSILSVFPQVSSDKRSALPHKDGNFSVGSDFVLFMQDVFEERDSDWCIAVSYLLITSDDVAIHYRCHVSGVQWQRRSVAKGGGGAGSTLLHPLLALPIKWRWRLHGYQHIWWHFA